MEIPQHLIKIKLTYLNALSINAYLLEIIKNNEAYLFVIEQSKAKQAVYLQHIINLFKPLSRHVLNHALTKKNFLLKLNPGERFTLVLITAQYPLPLDINFIEWEIKNQLFKTDFQNLN